MKDIGDYTLNEVVEICTSRELCNRPDKCPFLNEYEDDCIFSMPMAFWRNETTDRKLSKKEYELAKGIGAKFLTRGLLSDRVYLWDGEPETSALIGVLHNYIFPSIEEGQCIDLAKWF